MCGGGCGFMGFVLNLGMSRDPPQSGFVIQSVLFEAHVVTASVYVFSEDDLFPGGKVRTQINRTAFYCATRQTSSSECDSAHSGSQKSSLQPERPFAAKPAVQASVRIGRASGRE